MEKKTSEEKKNVKDKKKPVSNASFFSAVISLTNSTLGAGMLGIPLAYSKAGLFPAIVMQFSMAIMSYFSFYFMIYSSDVTQLYSLGEVCEIFSFMTILIILFINFYF